MRAVLSGVLLLVLAACGPEAGLGSGPAPLPTQSVSASFTPGDVADVIDVRAVDPQPMRTAELVAPDGGKIAASSIDVIRSPQTATGQFLQNDPFHGIQAGNIGTVPTLNAEANATLRGEARLLTTVSQASIPLADPVAYRRDWRNYRLRLGFGPAGGNLVAREIAAPAPPSAAEGAPK